jgi:hypothetical protein
MSNFLDPSKSGRIAGILHQNSVAVAERGPWKLDAVEYAEDNESEVTDINGFTSIGFGAASRHGGTCEICSAGIVNICRFHNAAGDKITAGVDCAETLLRNQDKLRFKAAVAAHVKIKRKAAVERKLERNKAAAPATVAALELDRLAGFSGFVGDFSRSLRSQLLGGKILSTKQLELARRLLVESKAC